MSGLGTALTRAGAALAYGPLRLRVAHQIRQGVAPAPQERFVRGLRMRRCR
jgi:hypothetical protein